jgi:hypothetical protein
MLLEYSEYCSIQVQDVKEISWCQRHDLLTVRIPTLYQ